MIQRKQTVFLLLAVVLMMVAMATQIGSFQVGGLEVGRLYQLWFTDPLGKRHLDTWPLMAILLPTAALSLYTIFVYRNRRLQALFCLVCALLIVGWYVCYFVVGQVAGDRSWGVVTFRPTWSAVLPVVSLILLLMARRSIQADERLVRSMDRIR